MARSRQTAEFNTFVRGIITDASPLTFPENASLDEDNFDLLRDGSRRRRLGMDLEESYVTTDTTIVYDESAGLVTSSFNWKNAGGNGSKVFVVVQIGARILFYDTVTKPISANLTRFLTLTVDDADLKPFSYASVDGKLVVATGGHDVEIFLYNEDDGTITRDSTNLKIRDSFGVEDIKSGIDLLEGSGLSRRIASATPEHLYNLRNQTWAVPRAPFLYGGSNAEVEDPIDVWRNLSTLAGTYPSNADSTIYGLFGKAQADDPVALRFNPRSLENNPPGNFRSPAGYFIIDLMQRGTSRKEELDNLHNTYSELNHLVGTLPVDKTPGGASVVAEFSGRVWYAGFSGELVDGDSQSPNLSSYIAYSQLVKNTGSIGKCYQDGDPTSDQFPDLLDTDGGFIKVDEAYNIQKLISVGDGLMVVAENGVWRVSGGSDRGFTANNHIVTKVTEYGTTASNSVVLVDGGIMYWGDDAIYLISTNEFGDWVSQPISRDVNKFYSAITSEEKADSVGIYDSYDNKVRWLYSKRAISSDNPTKELVFDVILKAFYPSTVSNIANGLPKPVVPVEVPPFNTGNLEKNVVVGVDNVVAGVDNVVATLDLRQEATREVAYVVVTDITDTIDITFASYKEPTFYDWLSVDSTGVDAPAYLTTGYINNGDYQRNKHVPHVTFHFRKTEDGFAVVGPDLEPTNQSSCLVQAQWDWTDSATAGRWGKEFQAYRHKRHYLAATPGDTFDNGHLTTVTRNKLRGKGRVLSLLLRSEAGKDLDLLGWGMEIQTDRRA